MTDLPYQGNFLASVPWKLVLRILGSEPPAALPGHAKCPLCEKQQLFIFDDDLWGGQWCFCGNCKEAHDLLGLAAKKLNLSFDALLVKLRRERISVKVDPVQLAKYDRFLRKRERADKFWKEARERSHADSVSAATLVQELQWRCGVNPEKRATTFAAMFGWASKQDVNLFFPDGDTKRAHTLKGDWEDALVVPYYDLPQRICGFLFIGRDADPDKDYVFREFIYQQQDLHGRDWLEGGLAMHPGAIRAGRQYGNSVVAIRDIALATQLQCRHIEHGHDPLPIVSWLTRSFPGRRRRTETRSWQQLFRRHTVFWMPKTDPVTFVQAARANGKISRLCPPNGAHDMQSYLSTRSSHSIINNVVADAKPWEVVLVETLNNLDEEHGEQLILEIAGEGLPIDDLLSRGEKLRRRVNSLVDEPQQFRSIQFDNCTIFQNDDHWYRTQPKVARNRQELIADAALEITHVIHQPSSGGVFYKGLIHYQHEALPFCVPQKLLDRKALTWMQSFLVKEKKGLLNYNPRFDRLAVTIATQLSPPRFVTGLDQVGWDATQSRFVFPNFAIHLGGEVRAVDRRMWVTEAPFWETQAPKGCAAADIEQLVAHPQDGPLIMATAVALLANMIAPTHEERLSIALEGPGASEAGRRVAKSYGAAVLCMNQTERVAQIREEARRHRVPAFLQLGLRTLISRQRAWYLEAPDAHHNSFIGADFWTSRVKRLTAGWVVVSGSREPQFSEADGDALNLVIANYLHRLCQHNIVLPGGETLVQAVLQDFDDFAAEICGRPNIVLPADYYLAGHTFASRAEAFVELLAELILQQVITYIPEEDPKADPLITITKSGDAVSISRTLFMLHVGKRCPVVPEVAQITAILADNKCLVGETDAGWLVKADWWLKTYTKYRDSSRNLFKVVG